jgi:glycine cleavage system aminomethyltransferase T
MRLYSPIFRRHEGAGVRWMDWGGWNVPATFTSVREETRMVRTGVGYAEYPALSHVLVEGRDALGALQRLCTRDLARCAPGASMYTLMLDDDGRPVDDGLVLRLAPDRFVISVASVKPTLLPPTATFFEVKRPKRWLQRAEGEVSVHPLAAFTVAVQGPRSGEMLRAVVDFDAFPRGAVRETRVGEVPVLCSRTGYSGERGVEFLVWPEHAVELWDTVVELGRPHGAGPFGATATLVLGFEMGFLNATDFYPGSTPVELGLEWAVAVEKPEFVGRDAVVRRRREGIRTRLVGLEVSGDGPVPRPGDPILVAGATVGRITNAAFSCTLERTLARGWLPVDLAVSGAETIVLAEERVARPARIAPSYRFYDPAGRRRA